MIAGASTTPSKQILRSQRQCCRELECCRELGFLLKSVYGLFFALLCRIVQINKDRRLLRKLQLDEQTELPQGVKLLLPAKVSTT